MTAERRARAQRLSLARAPIGLDIGERTAHSIRRSFISAKIARRDQNVDRLRKAVGHEDATATAGYSRLSQFFEREVDRWPDATLTTIALSRTT